jgi:serine/threonine-protein kinase
VWEARHASLGTRVAIKFIDPEFATSAEARARFDNEARAAASIQSKHAIQIVDHGMTDEGHPYMVMELLVGEPLDARLRRVGRLSPADTARIVGQVSRALTLAHARGIVHRDLKPENIFLVRTRDDEDDIAKVLDFGIAKMTQDFEGLAVRAATRTGALLGTPYYMSPEQTRGARGIDARTDLWSLGVIAYQCLTGVRPFDATSLPDLFVKITSAPIVPPTRIVPTLPAAVDAWVARVLERDRARRFASAPELADALALACQTSGHRGSSGGLPTAFAETAAAPPRWTPLPISSPQMGGPSATPTPYARSQSTSGRRSAALLVAMLGGAVVGVAITAFAVLRIAGTPHRDREKAPRTSTAAATLPPAPASTSTPDPRPTGSRAPSPGASSAQAAAPPPGPSLAKPLAPASSPAATGSPPAPPRPNSTHEDPGY